LVVLHVGVVFGAANGNGAVLIDDLALPFSRVDAQRKRRDVKEGQMNVRASKRQLRRLQGCAIGNGLVRIDRLVQDLLGSKVGGQQGTDLGDAAGAPHENDRVNLVLVELGSSQGVLHGAMSLPKYWLARDSNLARVTLTSRSVPS